VLKDKQSAQVSVLVRNRNWPFATSFFDAVVKAVEETLADALPQHSLLVQKETDGPFVP
jgi:hypothetical protein